MADNKNTIAYKMQKNPFAFVGIIMLVVIMLISIFAVSSSVKKSITRKAEETTGTTAYLSPTTEKETEKTTEASNVVELGELKQYVENIRSISADFSENRVAVNISFGDAVSLYNAFGVNVKSKIDIKPWFVFYLDNGEVLKLPCEYYISKDKIDVSFYLYEIDDYKNVLSLTDSVSIDYNNILTSKKFNLCFEDNNGNFTTISGNADKEYKDTQKSNVSSLVKGIEKVEIVKDKDFAWIDIYYTGESSYSNLNYKFENNFTGFNFETENGTKDYLFTVTEYDSLNMLRCKFDSYALKQINEECELEYESVDEFLKDITVYSSNYDTKTSLFSF